MRRHSGVVDKGVVVMELADLVVVQEDVDLRVKVVAED